MTEILTHYIKVDDYTELVLKIPKVLTAIELKALMVKANKIFNISEVPMRVETPKTTDFDPPSKLHSRMGKEKDAMLYQLIEVSKVGWNEAVAKLGIPKQKLANRKWYLANNGQWNKKLLEEKQ